MAKRTIEGKIAAVVNEKSVVINRGAHDGVTTGMTFTVQLELKPIQDPDDPTNVLEGVRFRKAILKVGTVFDRMAFCSIERVLSAGLTLGGFLNEPTVVGPITSPIDWRIRVGDLVEETEAS